MKKRNSKAPALRRIIRLDSVMLDKTYFTTEGYLIDNPIVTSVGIFEYKLEDGGVRRELRLPEHVFEPESLASYLGKPLIITHDAGEVNKNNVEEHQIGTILSKGYRDKNDVRAKIIIHDTDSMKDCKLRELSLGYSLDLDETPGQWNGQPYDAIQTNIRINHLALVESARAGEQARLNIDGREPENHILKGAKTTMSRKIKKRSTPKRGKRRDSADLSADEIAAAIAEYQARKNAGDDENAVTDDEDTNPTELGDEGMSAEEQVQGVRDNVDRRDSEGEPDNLDDALEAIAEQKGDLDTLLAVIDAIATPATDSDDEHGDEDEENADDEDEHGDEEENEDDEDNEENCEENEDDSESEANSMNADSIDRIVRTRVKLARIGDRLGLNLDGMSIKGAKKAIIKKVKPGLRLDGKNDTYISAAFDMAVAEMNSRKGTNHQRKQMFNGDASAFYSSGTSAAEKKRQEMIERQCNKKNGGKK